MFSYFPKVLSDRERGLQIKSSNPIERLACAMITISLFQRMTESTKPMKPALGTVNEGYNPENDQDRPQYLDEYLRQYILVMKKRSSC